HEKPGASRAFFYRHGWRVCRKCRSIFRRVSVSPPSRKTKTLLLEITRVRRKCRTHFSAGASQPTVPKNETRRRKCRSIFQRVRVRPLSRKAESLRRTENAGRNFRRVTVSNYPEKRKP